ncbi:ABC transporter substrate-binding protein [Testudinibacter aquarius]|uniref:ABC transporter substrate-binding protein n=1 Tax=Testudinibacter aquarius TaxID=1524974 RepID=A0A4R3YFE1_9PAST|nr:ABC transporter substrate-binding protein [Testudinibacter aquarius]KAE9529349.1 peptide ABC transporter substrate-binding protein [Testudinibacter aquarius]TCV89908.1 cationic peptide transport system substrate-binding protein [Testudinibacter aquarius]TNG91500.1 ABC transporter substrate-binding protein [Testudinibacter aquarius]
MCLYKKVRFCFFSLFLNLAAFSLLSHSVSAAPRIPDELLNNGLIYCTHSTGFSFNPQTVDVGTSMNVVTEQIYNKLFDIKNDKSKKIIPALATGYRFSDNQKTLLINLRKGVKFHQTIWFTPSRDLNADDVVFSLNRVLGRLYSYPTPEQEQSRQQNNPQYQIYYDLARQNRYPYFDSIDFNGKIASVSAVSPYQVKIELNAPDSSILDHLASQYAVILSQEYALQLSADDNIAQLDTLPVGTGAYQVSDYFRNQYVRLQRNDNYWGKKSGIKTVVVDLSSSRSGRLEKMLNQECDIMAFPEASQVENLLSDKQRFSSISVDGMNLAFLAFNMNQPLTQNTTLRIALAQAINRERLVKQIYFDTAEVANTIIPKSSWASQFNMRAFAYDYQPEIAKQFLQDKKLTLNFWVLTDNQVYNPNPVKMAEMIRFDLAQAGVQVKMKYLQRNELEHLLLSGQDDYHIILGGWLAGSLDPDGFLRPILSCHTNNAHTNIANWCSQAFDQVLDRALKTPMQISRALDYDIAQQYALNQVPLLPIANVKRLMIYHNRVQNMNMSPLGTLRFAELELRQER